MIDIKKAEGSHAEANPLREMAPTQSEVASSCATEIRQSDKTGSDLGSIVHVEPAASGRVRQIEQIDDEIRRAVEPAAFEHISVGDLKPNPHNARKHPESQIDLLAASMRQFGFVGAIIVDEDNGIISGHGRHEAAKRNGMDVVPCIRVTHLTAKAKIALALADNRLGELSAWDEVVLTSQLGQLLTPDLDFDFEVTGFDTVDADRLLGPEPDPFGRKSGTGEFSMDPDDNVPPLETEGPSVSQPGDMWDLGSHRVLHGDALDSRSYEMLLGDEVTAQIVTDPPYNVPNRGHVSSGPFRELRSPRERCPRKNLVAFLLVGFRSRQGRPVMAPYSMSSWIGTTWARCRRRSATQALSSRIYVFGPSRQPAWELSIAASTN
jgi:ParB/Sulfiredoxin domain